MEKRFLGLAISVLAICYSIPGSATSITIAGNSSHGTGDGSGTWNVTSDLGTTTQLTYDGGSSAGIDLGNGISLQLVCNAANSGGSCALGNGNPIDYLFQVPVSQLSNGTITFNNFISPTALPLTVQSLYCDESEGNGPGALCSMLPNNGAGITIDGTLNGTTLMLSVGGDLTNVTDVTFQLPDSNLSPTLSGPTMAGVTTVPEGFPEPASVLVVGSGLLVLISRRFKRTT